MTSEAKSTVNRQTDFYAFRVDKGETTFPEYAGGNGYTVRAVRTALHLPSMKSRQKARLQLMSTTSRDSG